MSILVQLLILAGALGVFLLGMKIMSEALQKVAGARLKEILSKITSNRFSGVIAGLMVTLVVQSSSATTVMVVSFVNAELLSLVQSIGVIYGANIGTTVTAWLVALLGFKVKITAFALPAVGIGMAMTFMKHRRTRQWGEVVTGFGVLFLGLYLLKQSVPGIEDASQMEWVNQLAGYGFGSVLIFLAIGTVLTIVLQSSSATTTLTLTLAALGWIPYEYAAAMVLGENIGTTATANLAAIGGSKNAKRAGAAHFFFNIFGVLWALALMRIYLFPVVDMLIPGDPTANMSALQGNAAAKLVAGGVITTHLAMFHTLFNVTNTLVMLPFVHQLTRLVERIVKSDVAGFEKHLRFLNINLINTPNLMLVQAQKEMQHLLEVVQIMFSDSMKILRSAGNHMGHLIEETLERETLTDELEAGIHSHLSVLAGKTTSVETSTEIAQLLENTHRLERMADHCAVLVRIASRNHDRSRHFEGEFSAGLGQIGDLVEKAINHLDLYLAGAGSRQAAEEIENEIDEVRRALRERSIQQLQDEEANIKIGLAFLDILSHLEEIGDLVIGIIRRAESA